MDTRLATAGQHVCNAYIDQTSCYRQSKIDYVQFECSTKTNILISLKIMTRDLEKKSTRSMKCLYDASNVT